jgi:hypothetical protein
MRRTVEAAEVRRFLLLASSGRRRLISVRPSTTIWQITSGFMLSSHGQLSDRWRA